MYEHLFSPIQIGSLNVKNRLFMSPMSTNFATPDGYVSDKTIYHYGSRAKGGAGLLITEVVMTEPVYKYIAHTHSLQDDSYIEGFRALADEVHRYGAVLAPQLLHPAYMALPGKDTPQLIGPSAVGPYYLRQPIRPLRLDELPGLVANFGQTALRAKKAGCDAVEIHAAHAHALLGGFLSPLYNKRTDAYGGSIDCRMRLLLEVIGEVQKTCGRDYPIIVRISGDDYEPGGQSVREGIHIARRLEQAGVAMLHVSGGTTIHRASSITPPGSAPGSHLKAAAKIKKAVSIPVGTVGRFTEAWQADEAIAEGAADIVVMGRALLRDPEFPEKSRTGRLDEIRPCVGCLGCLSSVMLTDHVECGINPSLEPENEDTLEPAAKPKKVLVIGGGPAGLEAAYVAAKRGHEVTLAEKEEVLGGQMIAASFPIAKNDLGKALKYYINRTKAAGVNILTNKEITIETVRQEFADYEIILAEGARPLVPASLKGHKNEVAAWDILTGKVCAGKNCVIIGGGSVGCETADFIAPLVNDRHPGNRRVTILEMRQNIVLDDTSPSRSLLVRRLAEKGVEIICGASVHKVGENEVCYTLEDGSEKQISQVDMLILAAGAVSNTVLAEQLKEAGIPFTPIGDGKETAKIKQAVAAGYEAGKAV